MGFWGFFTNAGCRFVLKPLRSLAASTADDEDVSSATPGPCEERQRRSGASGTSRDDNDDALQGGAGGGECTYLGVDPTQIEALDAAVLTYQVAWPLSIVVSQAALAHHAGALLLCVTEQLLWQVCCELLL